MSGTKEGGAKAAAKNKAKDPNFYKKIGAKGGRNGNTGGFASTEIGADGLTGRERAKVAGVLGGRMSSRFGVRNPSRVIAIATPTERDISLEELYG